MKLTPWHIAAALVMTMILASFGRYGAQLGLVGVTLGIFFGTLGLRRPTGDATTTHPGHG